MLNQRAGATHADPPDLAALPLASLKGIGPRLVERFAALGLRTVHDALFHLPLRYEDRTRLVPMAELEPGDRALVEGEVEDAAIHRGRRRMLVCRIRDETGAMTLRFFHFRWSQQTQLRPGTRLRCFGEVRSGAWELEMIHPEYRVLAGEEPAPVEHALTPVYPATEGLHQSVLRAVTEQALALTEDKALAELLPQEIIEPLRLPTLREALIEVHRPSPDAALDLIEQGRHPAQQRLAFEELLAHRLSLRSLREEVRRLRAPRLGGDGSLVRCFLDGLPFALTGSQRQAVDEILRDLAAEIPMQRLLQGDVGSGKTVVAACAALAAVEAGRQVAVMAPTELLAEQHLRRFRHWLAPLGLEVAGLSRNVKGAARREMLQYIAAGAAQVIVGTHALFQEDVQFADLGLIVVDEQHRFGVHQRHALREKGRQAERFPHQLIMTATPIPRTLAMVAYADLDCSTITEMPPGRTPVDTAVIPDTRRDEVIRRVREACLSGRQAYWVCTLIEESDALQAQAAADTAAQLKEMLSDLRVDLVHGRMKSEEKERVMAAFTAGDLHLLVATTVVEVGVDVTNASLMVIENAERLGMAQLHQLRGRVGRGRTRSHCILMYHGPLSEIARQRLATVRETQDGFVIARRDLELRGPGEVLGTRQAGMLQLHVADLMRDRGMLPTIERAAELMLARYPERVPPLLRRWTAAGIQYGAV
jgi:ATP-dependent DNA helicase RecG